MPYPFQMQVGFSNDNLNFSMELHKMENMDLRLDTLVNNKNFKHGCFKEQCLEGFLYEIIEQFTFTLLNPHGKDVSLVFDQKLTAYLDKNSWDNESEGEGRPMEREQVREIMLKFKNPIVVLDDKDTDTEDQDGISNYTNISFKFTVTSKLTSFPKKFGKFLKDVPENVIDTEYYSFSDFVITRVSLPIHTTLELLHLSLD
tara:strand:+ start:1124 stop:1726 length:603 start_codon:yes stop_codon:yes gene_type:complete